jgi:hypothetical protein
MHSLNKKIKVMMIESMLEVTIYTLPRNNQQYGVLNIIVRCNAFGSFVIYKNVDY